VGAKQPQYPPPKSSKPDQVPPPPYRQPQTPPRGADPTDGGPQSIRTDKWELSDVKAAFCFGMALGFSIAGCLVGLVYLMAKGM